LKWRKFSAEKKQKGRRTGTMRKTKKQKRKRLRSKLGGGACDFLAFLKP
jgi:hypothetical protein